MIVLHSVSKEIGKGRFRRTILDDVGWKISPRSRIVVLGHRIGASMLLNIMAGLICPSEGWVERRATISLPRGFLRYVGGGTTRQLIDRLSPLYNAHPREVAEFIEIGLRDRRVLDVKPQQLPAMLKQQLNVALTYAIPCDYYLFDGAIEAGHDPAFRMFCRTAFDLRCQEAGMIIAVKMSRLVPSLDGAPMGAILYGGKLTVYERLSDAMAIFDTLPPEADIADQPLIEQEEEEEEEIII